MTTTDRKGFAERIAKDYKKSDSDGEGSSKEEPESDDEATESAAGTELADALKSGDGAEIMRAFAACMEHCRGS